MLKFRSLNLIQSKNRKEVSIIKLTLLLMLMLSSLLYAQSETVVKVYDADGSFTQYNIEDIENIKFLEDSYSTKFQVYAYDSLAFDKYTYFIENVEYEDQETKNIIINQNYPFRAYPMTIEIASMDSIIISNTNYYENMIYSEAEISIDNFFASYWEYEKDEDGNRDSVQKVIEISENKQYKNHIIISGQYSGECGFFKRTSDLFICYDKFGYHTEGGDGTYNENFIIEIFIDEMNQMIDSLRITDLAYSKKHSSSTTGSGYNHDEVIIFKDIKYFIDGNSNIIIEQDIYDIEKINLNYFHYSYSSWGGGGYSSSRIETDKIVIQDNKPIKLKMVIK